MIISLLCDYIVLKLCAVLTLPNFFNSSLTSVGFWARPISYYATNKTVTRDSLIDCIASNKTIKADKGYSSSVQSQYTIHYFLDSSSNCIYIYATSLAYPPRVAFSALKKFMLLFLLELFVVQKK